MICLSSSRAASDRFAAAAMPSCTITSSAINCCTAETKESRFCATVVDWLAAHERKSARRAFIDSPLRCAFMNLPSACSCCDGFSEFTSVFSAAMAVEERFESAATSLGLGVGAS